MADETVCIYDVHNEIGLNVDIAHMRAFRVSTGQKNFGGVMEPKDIFKNISFVFDWVITASVRQKAHLRQLVLDRAGDVTYCVTKQTRYLVIAGDDHAPDRFKLEQANNNNIPIVTEAFIVDSIQQNTVQDAQLYFRQTGNLHKENTEKNDSDDKQHTLDSEKDVIDHADSENVPVWEYGDDAAPSFDESNYEVVKFCFLKKACMEVQPNHELLYILELHLSGNFRLEHQYRVYSNYDVLHDSSWNGKRQVTECRYFTTLIEARTGYAQVHNKITTCENFKEQKKLCTTPSNTIYGSTKFQNVLQYECATAVEVNLLRDSWTETWQYIRGYINTDSTTLNVQSIEKALGMLALIKEELSRGGNQEAVDCLTESFYQTLPHTATNQTPINNTDILLQKLNLCLVMKKVYSLPELAAEQCDFRDLCQTLKWRLLPVERKGRGNDISKCQAIEDSLRLKLDNLSSGVQFDQIQNLYVVRNVQNETETVLYNDSSESEYRFFPVNPQNIISILCSDMSEAALLTGLCLQKATDKLDADARFSKARWDCGTTRKTQFLFVSECSRIHNVVGGEVSEAWNEEERAPDMQQQNVYLMEVVPFEKEAKSILCSNVDQQPKHLCEAIDIIEKGLLHKNYCRTVGACSEKDTATSTVTVGSNRFQYLGKGQVQIGGDNCNRTRNVGLIKRGEHSNYLPVSAVDVQAKVMDMVAEVCLKQTFVNNSNATIDTEYNFPLDDRSAVTGFEAVIGDRHVYGKIQEKKVAHETYNEAVVEGQGACLLEQSPSDKNIFTMKVGNLCPQETVVVMVMYICELLLVDHQVCFQLPPVDSAEIENGSPGSNHCECAVQAAIEMPFDITTLECPTHDVKMERTATKADVMLKKNQRLMKEFQLFIGFNEIHLPRMWVERHPDLPWHQACMLTFNPDLQLDEDLTSEVIFLVDISKSMRGGALADAKDLLLTGLQTVPYKFNIMTFGEELCELFPCCKSLSAETKVHAESFIQQLEARDSFSELSGPLSTINRLSSSSVNTAVFIITDGNVNAKGVAMEMANHCGENVKIFTLGVGPDVDFHLLSALAREGGGVYEKFESNERHTWTTQMSSLLRKAGGACLHHLTLTWEQFESELPPCDQSPAVLPNLYSGSRCVVYGFVQNCTMAYLYGVFNGESVSTVVSTPELCITEGTILHSLTAQALIYDWQHGIFSTDPIIHQAVKLSRTDRILELSKDFNVLCPLTSFVAVEENYSKDRTRDRDKDSERESSRVTKVTPDNEQSPNEETPEGQKSTQLQSVELAQGSFGTCVAPAQPAVNVFGSKLGHLSENPVDGKLTWSKEMQGRSSHWFGGKPPTFQSVLGNQSIQKSAFGVGGKTSQGFSGTLNNLHVPTKGFGGSFGDKPTQGFGGSFGSKPSQDFGGAFGIKPLQGFGGAFGSKPLQGFGGAFGSKPSQGFGGAFSSKPSQGFGGAFGSKPLQGFGGAVGSKPSQGFGGAFGSKPSQGFGGAFGSKPSQGFGGAFGSKTSQGSGGAFGSKPSQGFGGAFGSKPSQGFGEAFGSKLTEGFGGEPKQGFGGAFGSKLSQDIGGTFGSKPSQVFGGTFGSKPSQSSGASLGGDLTQSFGGSLSNEPTQSVFGSLGAKHTEAFIGKSCIPSVQQRESLLISNSLKQSQSNLCNSTDQGLFGRSLNPSPNVFVSQHEETASNVIGSKTEQPAPNVFGSKLEQPVQTVFGSKPEKTVQNVFGSKSEQPAPNVFGSKPEQSVQNLFGSKPEQPVQNVFGSKPEQPVQTVFDSKSEQPVQKVFGSKPEQQVQNVFGSKPEQPVQTVFGSKPEQPVQSVFGNKAEQPAPNLFGSKPEQPVQHVFGSKAEQPAPNAFGSTLEQPVQSVFGSKPEQPVQNVFGSKPEQPVQNVFCSKSEQLAPDVFGRKAEQPAPNVFGSKPEQSVQNVFGSKPEQPVQTVFGSKPEQPVQSVFGSKPEQPVQHVFGSKPEQPAPNVFGSTPEQPVQSVFGSKPEQPVQSVFGSKPEQSVQSVFGSKPEQPVQSVFGSKAEQPVQSVFGSKPEQPVQSVFGSKPEQQVQSVFGSKAEQPAPNAFGSKPKQPSINIFGSKPEQPVQSVFGSKPEQPVQSVFGSKPEQPVQNAFGSKPELASSVCDNKTEQTAPNVFGSKCEQPVQNVTTQAASFGTSNTTHNAVVGFGGIANESNPRQALRFGTNIDAGRSEQGFGSRNKGFSTNNTPSYGCGSNANANNAGSGFRFGSVNANNVGQGFGIGNVYAHNMGQGVELGNVYANNTGQGFGFGNNVGQGLGFGSVCANSTGQNFGNNVYTNNTVQGFGSNVYTNNTEDGFRLGNAYGNNTGPGFQFGNVYAHNAGRGFASNVYANNTGHGFRFGSVYADNAGQNFGSNVNSNNIEGGFRLGNVHGNNTGQGFQFGNVYANNAGHNFGSNVNSNNTEGGFRFGNVYANNAGRGFGFDSNTGQGFRFGNDHTINHNGQEFRFGNVCANNSGQDFKVGNGFATGTGQAFEFDAKQSGQTSKLGTNVFRQGLHGKAQSNNSGQGLKFGPYQGKSVKAQQKFSKLDSGVQRQDDIIQQAKTFVLEFGKIVDNSKRGGTRNLEDLVMEQWDYVKLIDYLNTFEAMLSSASLCTGFHGVQNNLVSLAGAVDQTRTLLRARHSLDSEGRQMESLREYVSHNWSIRDTSRLLDVLDDIGDMIESSAWPPESRQHTEFAKERIHIRCGEATLELRNMEDLFNLQNDDGHWEFNKNLDSLLGVDKDLCVSFLNEAGLKSLGKTIGENVMSVLATVMVLLTMLERLTATTFPLSKPNFREQISREIILDKVTLAFIQGLERGEQWRESTLKAAEFVKKIDREHILLYSQLELGGSWEEAAGHMLGFIS